MTLQKCIEQINSMETAIGLENSQGYKVEHLIPIPKDATEDEISDWLEYYIKTDWTDLSPIENSQRDFQIAYAFSLPKGHSYHKQGYAIEWFYHSFPNYQANP